MYNAHYRFRECPFGATPDPQFYYSNAVYREAWATLRYGVEGRKGFVLITGEAGTGKTTLLRKALHEFPPSIKAAYVPSTALVGFDDLLRLVLKDLGLAGSANDKFAMIERFNDYLLERFKAGDRVALLIDEAQDLSVPCLEELRLLGNLETDKHKLLQIVLVGQPDLEAKLNRLELLQLRQRVVLRCRLRPIEAQEVRPYLEARLRILGRNAADVFEAEAIARIALYSKGIPRLINSLCDNALLNAYAESRLRVSAAKIEEAAHDLLIAEPRTIVGVRQPMRATRLAAKALGRPIDAGFALLQGACCSRSLIGAFAVVVLAAGFLYLQSSRSSASNASRPLRSLAAEKSEPPNQLSSAAPNSAVRPRQLVPAGLKTAFVANPQSGAERDGGITRGSKLPRRLAPAKPMPSERGRSYARYRGTFFVAGASFVRSQPSSGAEIIATLEPGTRIAIAGRTGAYYRVRSLENNTIYGYVHEEDAFFERP